MRQFILVVGGGASKITADGDYSHEIKRYLLLEEKLWQAMTVLKNRDIMLSPMSR